MEKGKAEVVPFRMFGISEQDFERAKVVFVLAPYDATTTFKAGTRDGPAVILKASLVRSKIFEQFLKMIDAPSEVLDAALSIDEIWGEEAWHPIADDGFLYTIDGLVCGYGGSTKEYLASIYSFIWEQIVVHGKLPFLIGGEHSLAYPNIKAIYHTCNDFSILHLDAHPDLRKSYRGDYFSHSAAMRRSFELGPKVSLTSVGIRSVDRDVRRYIKEQRALNTSEKSLHIFGSRNLNFEKIDSTLKEKIYISLDLDVIDGLKNSNVGTPQPGGLSWDEITALVKYVIERHEVLGMDVVELAPIPGVVAPNVLAAKLIWRMVEALYQKEKACIPHPA